MGDISDRILYVVQKEANGNAEKFGKMTGFSGQTIRYVTELKRNKPSLDLVVTILQTFVWINPDWLLFGKEPRERKENPPDKNTSDFTPEWLLKRIEELAIENNDLKKEICRLTDSKKNNLYNVATEHEC